jgi:hypothetical protein
MKNTFLKTTVGTFLALVMLFAGTQIFVSGQESETGDSPEEQTERIGQGIEGAWRTAVTPRNCQTGLPVAPVIRGLFTFNEGGTMAEYGIGPGQSPALRSPGHGVWEQRHGRHNYSFKFMFYRYDASGVFIGSQKVTAALELGAGGDSFTTNSAIEVLDANDNLIGSGCATAAGTRFE